MQDGFEIHDEVDDHGRRVVASLIADRTNACRSVTYVAETDSTNTLAVSLARSGEFDPDQLPHLVLADHQTSGRGRQGCHWHGDGGTLMFSLVIPNNGQNELLPLGVGVGIARFLEFEFAPLRVQLKWPNDVWLGESKVAGVLCESVAGLGQDAGHVVIGVGMNVASHPELHSEQSTAASVQATSLSHHLGRPIHRFDVLAGIVQAVHESLDELAESPESLVAEFQSRCALRGNLVSYDRLDASQTAICDGIDASGGLLVRSIDSSGPSTALHSGEVRRLRPA